MIWKLRLKKHLSIHKMSKLLNIPVYKYVFYEVYETFIAPRLYVELSYILQFDINH